MLGAVGTTVWVHEEDALDVVTALSGSGPAYFFLLAELMTDAAVNLGLDRASAQELAIQTLFGSGRMARDSDGDLARLRAEVTSKGGTTEAALRSFDAANLRGIVAAALSAATDREPGNGAGIWKKRNNHERPLLPRRHRSPRCISACSSCGSIMQIVRANFRNPFAEAVLRLTNPLIMPLRRILPPVGKIDTASVLAIVLFAVFKVVLLSLLFGGGLFVAVRHGDRRAAHARARACCGSTSS